MTIYDTAATHMPLPITTITRLNGELWDTVLLTAAPYIAVAVVPSGDVLKQAYEDLVEWLGQPGDQQGVLFLAPNIDLRRQSSELSIRSLAKERITVETAKSPRLMEQQARDWLRAELGLPAEAR